MKLLIQILYHVTLSYMMFTVSFDQGFMQDQIIASHTCFGRHMDVNC